MYIKPLMLILVVSCCISFNSDIHSQTVNPSEAIISIENQHLIAGMNNSIRIVAQQAEPVALEQLSATFQAYSGEEETLAIISAAGFFVIRPNAVGLVRISITLTDTVETKVLRVKPLEAVGRLGRFRANKDEKISIGEFKAQAGIVANIECCGFDAKCRTLGFQMLRINQWNETQRIVNQGGRFTEDSRDLILQAEVGDIYIFRQIRYQCPGTEAPQRLDDMIFEIY